jgi:hypothetical protein
MILEQLSNQIGVGKTRMDSIGNKLRFKMCTRTFTG